MKRSLLGTVVLLAAWSLSAEPVKADTIICQGTGGGHATEWAIFWSGGSTAKIANFGTFKVTGVAGMPLAPEEDLIMLTRAPYRMIIDRLSGTFSFQQDNKPISWFKPNDPGCFVERRRF